MTTATGTDAEKFSEEVAHIERTALVQQSRRLIFWGRSPAPDRIARLTPLATAFDNRVRTAPQSSTGGVVVVVSGHGQAERKALLSLLGILSARYLPVLLVVKDDKDDAYYRSLDPNSKDVMVLGTVSNYVAHQAAILNSLQNPPPTIQREFARVIASARLLETGGTDAKPPRPGFFAPLRRRRRRPVQS
ncbi:MAG: hypothetical protein JRN35_09650 [Nitrososphaerota archaeon]|nr:hypothetical protein [Nitrososphaerota archaeon]